MTGWVDLATELELWRAAGRRATFWWRDDDAVTATPALARLLALSDAHGIPIALAVIPAAATAALAEMVATRALVVPIQHGYAHRSHAAPGSKTGELAPTRPREINLAELAEGWRRLRHLFGNAAAAILAPPWNRIDPALISSLPGLGFRGLSTYGARKRKEPVTGLIEVNTHLDIVDWRGGRGFVGESKALAQLVDHLRARRRGIVDGAEPSGLLTHHLVHDEACWAFLDALFAATRRSAAAAWLDPRDIFATAAPVATEAAS